MDISQVNRWSELLKEHKIDMQSLGTKAYEQMVAGIAAIEARLAAYAQIVKRISAAA